MNTLFPYPTLFRVAVLLGKPADFRLHRLVGLALEQPGGRPVDEAEQHRQGDAQQQQVEQRDPEDRGLDQPMHRLRVWADAVAAAAVRVDQRRSEEHTSELQSLMRISYAVFCL